MKHVIDIHPDGSVEAMHNDDFSLSFLGNQSIQRATEIVFNEKTQTWGIFFPIGKVSNVTVTPADGSSGYSAGNGRLSMSDTLALDFKTYEGARQVEVAWLNECRLNDVQPMSNKGMGYLACIRKNLGL